MCRYCYGEYCSNVSFWQSANHRCKIVSCLPAHCTLMQSQLENFPPLRWHNSITAARKSAVSNFYFCKMYYCCYFAASIFRSSALPKDVTKDFIIQWSGLKCYHVYFTLIELFILMVYPNVQVFIAGLASVQHKECSCKTENWFEKECKSACAGLYDMRI